MAFLKKFDIKQICVVNHQEINILSNFGSRKTKNREMIGSSVKDFGSFYQKTLEPIFSKDRKTTALIEQVSYLTFRFSAVWFGNQLHFWIKLPTMSRENRWEWFGMRYLLSAIPRLWIPPAKFDIFKDEKKTD